MAGRGGAPGPGAPGPGDRPRFGSWPPVAAAVAATPPSRDRVVDAARAAALLVVVVGHGVMAVVAWPDGVPRLGNLLAAFPWTQGLTWMLQIMPLFFWAGGAANAISWEGRKEGTTYAAWVWARGRRLLRPVIVYLAVMAAVATVVTLTAPAAVAAPLMALTTQLLWFLGAYLITVALTPLCCRRPVLVGAGIVAALLVAAGAIDWLRLLAGGPEAMGLLNFVAVWMVPTVLGVLRTEGRLAQVAWPLWIGVAALTAAVNAVLIHEGPWPISMVGMPGEPVSNMAPPTVVLALHCVTLVALVQAFDRPLRAALDRPGLWRPVVAVNLVAMTLYLWHLPTLIALTALGHALHLDRPVALDPFGFPVPDGWGYAPASALFWAVYGLSVAGVVRLAWPAEHLPLPWWDAPTRSRTPRPGTAAVVAGASVVLVGASTLVLSATGLGGFPTAVVEYAGLPLTAVGGIVGMLVGGALLRWAGAPRAGARVSRTVPARG